MFIAILKHQSTWPGRTWSLSALGNFPHPAGESPEPPLPQPAVVGQEQGPRPDLCVPLACSGSSHTGSPPRSDGYQSCLYWHLVALQRLISRFGLRPNLICYSSDSELLCPDMWVKRSAAHVETAWKRHMCAWRELQRTEAEHFFYTKGQILLVNATGRHHDSSRRYFYSRNHNEKQLIFNTQFKGKTST